MAAPKGKPEIVAAPSDMGQGKALETMLASLNKKYGEGIVMKLGKATKLQVEAIPSGSLSLDVALGVGGYPKGRMVEISRSRELGQDHPLPPSDRRSPETGGHLRLCGRGAALDPAYAAKIGVDVNSLYVSQPDTGEQALEITEALVRYNAMDVVVVDSVAALVPRAEIEGEMGDSHMGLQARLMSQALRKLTGSVKGSNTCLVFTNRFREKIGVMFGNPETTTGGMALKFYASIRLDVRRIESIKQGDEAVGNRTRVTVKKNRVAHPSAGRVRHHVQRRHQHVGRYAGSRGRRGGDHQARRLLQLRRAASGPGPGERQDVPGGKPQPCSGDRRFGPQSLWVAGSASAEDGAGPGPTLRR